MSNVAGEILAVVLPNSKGASDFWFSIPKSQPILLARNAS